MEKFRRFFVIALHFSEEYKRIENLISFSAENTELNNLLYTTNRMTFYMKL